MVSLGREPQDSRGRMNESRGAATDIRSRERRLRTAAANGGCERRLRRDHLLVV
jgi:hypothetical protein